MGAGMKVEGWEMKLAEAVNAALDTPFAWGSHDCVLFAADVTLALTGVDYAEPFRFTYGSARGAARVAARNGGIRAIVGKALGDEIPVYEAMRGDVVMIEQDGEPALGICLGMVCACAAPVGLTRVPMEYAVTAWRVD